MNAASMHAFRRRALLPFRLAFTAFAFALFGLGGIVFGFFLTPWLKMAGGTPEEKKSLARRVVKRWFGLFVSVITSLGLVRIEVKNPEAFLKKGAILAANRPITPVRISAHPRWLTKDAVWWRLPQEPMVLTFEALPEIDVQTFQKTYNQSFRRAAVELTNTVGRALFPHL